MDSSDQSGVTTPGRTAHDRTDMLGLRAVAALHALGQQMRLSVFRLLVRHEPCGMSVGAIAQIVQSPQNTISAHLAVLARAQMVTSARQGRSVVYRADLRGIRWLIEFLLADCCHGDVVSCATMFSAARNTDCPTA